jgi:Protein of unknown function (DUF2924)
MAADTGLRLQRRNVFGGAAPLHLPKPLVARIIAYRLQADAFGIFPTRSVGHSKASTFRSSPNGQTRGSGLPYRRRIKPGSILVREWNGHLQRVTALEDSFAWEGKTYRSLSMVARAITGGHWNGPRFFGLTGSKAMVGARLMKAGSSPVVATTTAAIPGQVSTVPPCRPFLVRARGHRRAYPRQDRRFEEERPMGRRAARLQGRRSKADD